VLGLRLHGAVLPGPCNCSWKVWHLQWKSLVMSVAYNDKSFATTVEQCTVNLVCCIWESYCVTSACL